jgi:hypothetical protein
MNHNPRQPDARFAPSPVAEDRLVDWIDGAASPEEARALASESGRADLGDRIVQMQRQRDVLRALKEDKAPADLRDRVLAALERDALVGLAADADANGSVQIPRDRMGLGEEGGVLARIGAFSKAHAPRLAMAAGLLLLVGGATYFGSIFWRESTRPTVPYDPSGTTQATREGATTGEAGAGATGSSAIAMNDGSGVDSDPAPQTDDPALALSSGEASEPLAGMRRAGPSRADRPDFRAERDSAPIIPVSLDRAVELAREGRLAIRVQAKELRGLALVERSGASPTPERQWRMSTDVSPATLASVLPAVLPEARRSGLDRAMFATAMVSPLVGPGAAITTLTPRFGAGSVNASTPIDAMLARVSASYMLEASGTSKALDLVRTMLRDRLEGAVEFIELPDALTPTSLGAKDLLWWTQPSAEWTPRVSVPVVVEGA